MGPDAQMAVVIGAGGIGAALAARLLADESFARVFVLSRDGAAGTPPADAHARRRSAPLDLADEKSIERAAAFISAEGLPVRCVMVATGVLQDSRTRPEKSWRSLDPAALAHSFAVNAIGPALIAKHFLPLLPREGRAVFAALSARVGSIGDNRLGGWYGYRASKAALNQLIRCAAIELARSHPAAICVALHPGTVETRLSRPFVGTAQRSRLFSPDEAAERLLAVIDGLEPADTGGFFAWDGSRIEF